MNEIQYSLPIEHLSYSSMSKFCSNRAMFKKLYILNQWQDEKSSIVMVIGTAVHVAIQAFLDGVTPEKAVEKALAHIESLPDSKINFGKTGSREEINKYTAVTFNFFLAEVGKLNLGEVLATEKSVTADFILSDGSKAPLPIKAVTDAVTRQDDGIHLWDWKTVVGYSDPEDEQPQFVLQAMFNYLTIERSLGEKPVAMHFVEIKKTKNRDGSPQLEVYTIEYAKHPEYIGYFERMYSGVVYELVNPNIQFLPNFSDQMSGKQAWKDFTSELMDFDMPKQISHRATIEKVSEERSFVASYAEDLSEKTDVEKVVNKFMEFGIMMKAEEEFHGASFTLHTFKPARGVKMSKIKGFEEDLQLAVGAESVRILAPMPGTNTVGVEVSNPTRKTVLWKSKEHTNPDTLIVPIGVDVKGVIHYLNLSDAPHLLVAGATGTGKSVFLNVLIQTLIRQNDRSSLEMTLIDPKRTEFSQFEKYVEQNITEVATAFEFLNKLVTEMEDRYKILQEAKVKNILDFRMKGGFMSSIVVVIDELADLLMSDEVGQVTDTGEDGEEYVISTVNYSSSIESFIIRLAQKARAAGIHLVVATQRPSANIITGVMKANFPTRVAFTTATGVDSKVILDETGAEKLLRKGDLLFKFGPQLKRLQGLYL